MQYNFRGIYDPYLSYVVQDVVSYQPTINDPVKYYFCLTVNDSVNPQTPNQSGDTIYWAIVNALSNFPNSVDTFLNHTNIQASDQTDINRFQELTLKSNRTTAEDDELNILTQTLREKLILPQDFNALQESISNLQMFFKTNVEGYINQKQDEFNAKLNRFSYKGIYNPTIQYYEWNTVKYNGSTYLCIKDSIGFDPANTTYWEKMADKGDKGDKGLPGANLVFRGTYNPSTTYNIDDAVEYNGSVYYCTQTVVGEIPQDNGLSWDLFLARGSILISNTTPTSPTDKQVWIDSVANKMKRYDSALGAWIELNAENANKFSGKTLTEVMAQSIKNKVVLTSDSVSATIGIVDFDKSKDTLWVIQNSVNIDELDDYSISADSLTITKVNGLWLSGTELSFRVFKNVAPI